MRRIVYGKNSVKEALKSSRGIDEILVSKDIGGLTEILNLAKNRAVTVKFVSSEKIKSYGEKTQGVVAFCSDIKIFSIPEILQSAKRAGKDPFILICDRVQDPHNLGALFRTAYAFGVDGIILPKRRSATINATVEKASAGAINFLKIAIISNLVYGIKKLQEEGVFIFCADAGGRNFSNLNFKGAVALVVGSEGEGVSKLVKKRCDEICSIPMKREFDSLNVSVAAAIVMYEISKQNGC